MSVYNVTDFITKQPVPEEDPWEEMVVYEITNPDLVILPRPPVDYHYELMPNGVHHA